jgi:hypothetical protein
MLYRAVSQDFTTPDERTKQFRDFVETLAALDRTKAAELAKGLDYQLVEIDENGKKYLVASDDSGSGRDPTIVINTAPKRDIIFEAPHVPFEVGTAEQAVVLLRSLDGVAALISGAHRCASKSFTACDGKTPVCTGEKTQYPDSDVGHNTKTLFHSAHLALADRWKKAVVVSLHGMKGMMTGSAPRSSSPMEPMTRIRTRPIPRRNSGSRWKMPRRREKS